MPRSVDAPALLKLGIFGRSRKENERRLAIHPAHFARIDPDLRQQLYLEAGYGEPFGVSDEQLSAQVAGLLPRAELIAAADIVMIPKVLPGDLEELRDGQIVWGWPHCVQDVEVTQLAIDRRLTMIAFEAMNLWSTDGGFLLHVFHKNNELAGYCSVLHALQLVGSTGDYGRRLRAVVIGFGATARGAVTALNAQGIGDVRVLTNRHVAAVGSPIHSVQIVHFDHDDNRNAQQGGHKRGPDAVGPVSRRQRHRRQLRAAGHRGAVDVPGRGRPWCLPAGQPDYRCVL